MLGGIIFYALLVVGMQFQNLSYGYNYGNVVLDGELWRLGAAALSHANAGHANLSIIGLLLAGWADEKALMKSSGGNIWSTSFYFVSSMALMSFLCQFFTLACINLALNFGLPASEVSAEPGARGADTRWLAHGFLAPALARIACSGHRLTDRPSVLALLLIFAIQIVAPNEPVSPNIFACILGIFLSRLKALDNTIHSAYWTTTTLCGILFFSLCSLKATRPNIHLPGFDYSNAPSTARTVRTRLPYGAQDELGGFDLFFQDLLQDAARGGGHLRRSRHSIASDDDHISNDTPEPDGSPQIVIIDAIARNTLERMASAIVATAMQVESESVFEPDAEPLFFRARLSNDLLSGSLQTSSSPYNTEIMNDDDENQSNSFSHPPDLEMGEGGMRSVDDNELTRRAGGGWRRSP
uniref:Peptidase S54 rhomboid domain-containing protein n=1 Tax=Aureoumbra lagunensis TaxID=44058 RepID=A0A7S3K6U6_9STRA